MPKLAELSDTLNASICGRETLTIEVTNTTTETVIARLTPLNAQKLVNQLRRHLSAIESFEISKGLNTQK